MKTAVLLSLISGWLISCMSLQVAQAFSHLTLIRLPLKNTRVPCLSKRYYQQQESMVSRRQLNSLAANNGDSDNTLVEQEKTTKLLISLLVDLIGISSFALPLAGEGTDIAWAPISAAILQYLYGNSLITGLGFVEELLPGFDFIPTATLGWFLTYYGAEGEPSKPPSQQQQQQQEQQRPSPPAKEKGLPDSGKANNGIIDV